MRFVRYLPHWLGGPGAHLQGLEFVPVMPPIRPWADPCPWAALGQAIEQRFDPRFPNTSPRGRRPGPRRVWLALALLTPARGASDEDICHRLRTDFAVRYACGLREYPGQPSPAHFVLPETRCEVRSRLDAALREERSAMPAAAAMEAGLVRPAPLGIDTLPREHGRPRGTAATPRYQAQKKRSHSSRPSRRSVAAGPPRSTAKPTT
jgi:Transposase domain (DUF772)